MKNILVIEDSKTMNNIISKELKKHKFEVSQAFTFKEAKEFLNLKEYQLVILDLHLPDGEGSELIANIQSLTTTKVVVLTSSKDDSLREELFEYGILDYIIKDKNLLYSIAEIIKIIYAITAKKQDKVLIIDDSQFICKQIQTILEPRNYQIRKALNAKDGLRELSETVFDLLILDMELPDMHGIKVLELIRKNSRFGSLPIIILSGSSTPEIIRNSLKNGANDFLKKPFVFEEFILKVDLWIDYFKKDKMLAQKTRELEYMNSNLQQLVSKEVEKNHQKDRLMFAQSRQAQMGEMISMIAHQWRQPLNAIGAAVGLIDFRVQTNNLDPKVIKDTTTKINTYIQYLSNTINDFKDFFKPQKDTKITTFKTILDKTLILVEHTIKSKGIEIVIDIQSIKEFNTYENELIQVVLNIIKNSIDAFDNLQDNKTPHIIISIDGNILSIEDNAGGISDKILERIFDPYFSTKGKNGTGLGLYMSKMIIEEHCQGNLRVKSSNLGATFIIEVKDI